MIALLVAPSVCVHPQKGKKTRTYPEMTSKAGVPRRTGEVPPFAVRDVRARRGVAERLCEPKVAHGDEVRRGAETHEEVVRFEVAVQD